MAYEPRKYWNDRFRSQGESYVTRAGRPVGYAANQAKRLVSELREIEPVDCLLDFGCGPARLAGFLREKCQRYIGVDIVDHTSFFNEGEFVHLDASTIQLPDCSVDAVVAVTVFQHIPDDDIVPIASELLRLAKPGCRLYVVDDAGPSGAEHMHCRRPDRLFSVLGARLDVVRRADIDHAASHYSAFGEIGGKL